MLKMSVCIALAGMVLSAAGLSGAAALDQAEGTALTNRAFQSTMQELVPAFNATGGHHVSADFDGPSQVAERVKNGESVDFVLSPRANIDELIKAGKVQPDSVVDVARVSVGVAIRKGAPKPDISTPEALKRTLLAARAISFPGGAAPSGVHFAKVLDQLGIADTVKAKIRHPGAGQFAADLLVSGEADIAVQTFPELLGVSGVELLGPLPHDLESVSVFTAAVPTAAHQPDVGRALIKFLQSPAAATIIKAKGMEPIAR